MPSKGRLGLIVCLTALLAAQLMSMDHTVPSWMIGVPLFIAFVGLVFFILYPNGDDND